MMYLSDVRDYIASLNLAEYVYMGKLDAKKEKSIGVYHSKRTNAYKIAIGGVSLESYGLKHVTLLVHWNKSLRDTEKAATRIFDALEKVRDVTINNQKIKFIQLLCSEPIGVGTDDAGIYEMVIEAAVVYAKGVN